MQQTWKGSSIMSTMTRVFILASTLASLLVTAQVAWSDESDPLKDAETLAIARGDEATAKRIHNEYYGLFQPSYLNDQYARYERSPRETRRAY
jgi:hypothetical protein